MRLVSIVLAALLIGLSLLLLADQDATSGARKTPQAKAAEDAELVDAPAIASQSKQDPARLDLPRASAPQAKDDVEAPAATPAVEDVAAKAVGFLRFQVADAASGAPLDGVTVSLESEQRFARVQADTAQAPMEVPLSPGSYRMLLTCPGFDPMEADEIVIESEKHTDLGTRFLPRGSARLECWVLAPTALDRELTIELYGVGRNPCHSCSPSPDPCERCGYSESLSKRSAQSGEVTDFAHLAAGEYQVWVRGSDEQALLLRRIELAAGERRWLELQVETLDISVRVLHADGRPMEGEWMEEDGLWAAPVRFQFMQDGLCVAVAEIKPPSLQTADPSAAPPPEEEDEFDGESSSTQRERPSVDGEEALSADEIERLLLGQGQVGSDGGGPGQDSRMDVQRQPYVSFWPRVVPINPKTAPLSSLRLGPGLTAIKEVPLDADGLIVSCGPYFSVPEAIDLSQWDGAAIEVTLLDRCGTSSQTMKEMKLTNCTACHTLPGSMSW